MWIETAVSRLASVRFIVYHSKRPYPEASACGLKRPYPVGEYAIYRLPFKTAVPEASARGLKRPYPVGECVIHHSKRPYPKLFRVERPFPKLFRVV